MYIYIQVYCFTFIVLKGKRKRVACTPAHTHDPPPQEVSLFP